MTSGDYGWAFFAATLMSLGIWVFYQKTEELVCERDFNVYDCEYEWHPIYGEELEGELIP